MKMTPIPTMYKGVKFRSRLEARYAVLFDALNIKWEYEKEGYELSDGTWYLPDFYLPEVYIRAEEERGVFFEVKGTKDDADENKDKLSNFEKPLVVACGAPTIIEEEWLYEWWKSRWDHFMFFKFCEECNIFEIDYSMKRESTYCRKCNNNKCGQHKDWDEAVSEMKSYRFDK